ncbi:TPA: hypothetical protein DCG61_00650 [Patescibacteria group bacterium]|jgi:N12 class adenine-specific DNA methylase|nr:hypothetical protein [Patescibacteria group bacterium]
MKRNSRNKRSFFEEIFGNLKIQTRTDPYQLLYPHTAVRHVYTNTFYLKRLDLSYDDLILKLVKHFTEWAKTTNETLTDFELVSISHSVNVPEASMIVLFRCSNKDAVQKLKKNSNSDEASEISEMISNLNH